MASLPRTSPKSSRVLLVHAESKPNSEWPKLGIFRAPRRPRRPVSARAGLFLICVPTHVRGLLGFFGRGLVDRLQQRTQLADAIQAIPARGRQGLFWQLFVIPGHVVGDMNGPGAQSNDRRDVRAE